MKCSVIDYVVFYTVFVDVPVYVDLPLICSMFIANYVKSYDFFILKVMVFNSAIS